MVETAAGPRDGAPALEVSAVTVRFGPARGATATTVLDRVHLSAAAGEIVALLGPSGSGKSTLLRVIAGLVAPDEGAVAVGGRDVTHLPAHRRGVGLVFQDEQLFPHLDVAGNVGFGPRMQGVPAREIRDRVGEVLEMVGMAGLAGRRTGTLSGGEAKRVALARSLAARPSVLLLDEPLTGLDRELHDRLTADLASVLRAAGTTAVLVTHDPDEAAAIADRSLTMAQISGA